jgi:hypothetical protein
MIDKENIISSDENSETDSDKNLIPYYKIYVYGEDNDRIEEIYIDPKTTNSLGGQNGIYSLISSKFQNQYTPLEHTMKIKLTNIWYTINDMNIYNFCISGNLSSGDIIKMKLLKNNFIEEYSINEGKENYNPDQEILNANNVKNKPIPPEKKINCSLCRQNSEYLYERLLKLYGPFRYKSRVFYAHFLCLIYIPEIEISEKDTFKNPGKIINDYIGMKCAFCGEKGATLCCCYNNTQNYNNPLNIHCKNRFHYLCAIKSGCKISRLTYNVLCPKHIRYGYPTKIENENKNNDKNNINNNNELNNINNNEKIIIDDDNEENSKNNEIIINDDEKNNEINLNKKNFCYYCNLIVNEDESIQCTKCLNYYHESCVGISHKVNYDDSINDEDEQNYICPDCLAKINNKIN